MRFDRRVVSEPLLTFIRRCQAHVPCHLGGGAVLSGVHLGHRLTRDLDLFCHDSDDYLQLRRDVTALGRDAGLAIRIVRDARTFARYVLEVPDSDAVELDLVEEPVPDIEPSPEPVEGIIVESLADLRASKLTCILSRSEPRDLVDLLFLDRAGFPPEADLALALRKDGGIDPGVLVWLLDSFPCRPLPHMLEPLTEDELDAFRRELQERLRHVALPPER
ncbi:MAG: nucleotidyl transferase AbiEii/AbiGii toxin family protein [Armatimonadetes bacterium]|nr:nucleotidyl transferase AbiEii/AbiGii toxin family protein [Armatimonadota bacterium]